MPTDDAEVWARICRIEAARTAHPATMAFLLELAAEYDALASGAASTIGADDAGISGRSGASTAVAGARMGSGQEP